MKDNLKLKEYLYVNQIFPSIQCEGYNIGIPSVFLRLSHCNLCCSWCDTQYTWKHNNNLPGSGIYDLSNFQDLLKQLYSYNIKNLVITGGEPFLYWNNYLFNFLIDKSKFESIEIETNGSLFHRLPKLHLPGNNGKKILFNISPKLESKFYKVQNDYKLLISRLKKNLPRFYYFGRHLDYCFKFVYGHQNIDIIETFIKKMEMPIPNSHIIMMPLTPHKKNYDMDYFFQYDLRTISHKTVKYCMEKNYRFSPRLQIYLFNDEKEELTES